MSGRRRLSVAYLPTRYPVLSETFVRLEVEELRRRGAEVTVLSLLEGEPRDPSTTYLFGQGRPRWLLAAEHLRWALRSPRRYLAFHGAARRAGPERGEVLVRHLPWAATQLRRRGVQLLHAHFAWSSAARARALSALTGLPWTMTVHAHDMFGKPVLLQDKLAAAAAVVTVCRYNVEHLREDWGFEGPVDLVVCGVEAPDPVPLRSNGVDVLAVGRLVPKKGFDLLVDAVATMHRPGLRVELIGDGPERGRLDAAVVAAGLEGVVRLVGPLPHEEVLARMSAAALVCLPARIASDGDRDSMPLVVKEALAREVPVVATEVAGVPEMLDDECGWLVPADDPAALAVALADALDHPEEATRRARAGRERVLAEFRLEDEVAKLEGVFRRVLGEPA